MRINENLARYPAGRRRIGRGHGAVMLGHNASTGVDHVFINGVQVLRDGEHTGAKPGRVVRGPGWTGWVKETP